MSLATATTPLHTRRFYGDYTLVDPKGMLRAARSKLRDVDFDTVVGTGMSGIPAATLIGNSMGKHILLVRKPDDKSNHHGGPVVGELGARWIFVDDFVSSGSTRRRVADEIHRLTARGRPSYYVGTYSFGPIKAGWEPSDDGIVPKGPYA